MLLTLVSASVQPLPDFTPGAHIDVVIPGCGKRQYSLCFRQEGCSALQKSACAWIRTQRVDRAGCIKILRRVDQLLISAPRNHFPLPDAPRTLLFAAGIGLTPLLMMAETLADRQADFTLHLYLKHCDELAFARRLEQLGDRVVIHYSSEGDSLRQRVPTDLTQPHNSVLVSCGPAGFMEHLHQLAVENGWNISQLYSERFKPVLAAQSLSGGAFEVRLLPPVRVTPSLPVRLSLKCWKRAGIGIDLSCEQGMCGACITGVLTGVPDHRDQVLSQKNAPPTTVSCCAARVPILLCWC
ncbi:PDR/VanB family oxidoreductase [Pantoea sp. LMR881]|uniref:PDR/VanB family oxidoreductase n=1 Tax=Pantoea sp. LMR881 TaxID=3014336 RepID=UPI0022AF8B30|nr:PDR/VanB family oxidoreductase [Pantoea sp. LMR881]MCZ4061629.1 PDR/VanB family oxidoreductase [Pantoea sp. LMR881]